MTVHSPAATPEDPADGCSPAPCAAHAPSLVHGPIGLHGLTLHVAASFGARAGGLLVRPPLGTDEALWLSPCNSVHTAFMGYAIDVIFVGGDGRVMRVADRLAPWRMAGCWGAAGALELRAGQAGARGLVPGTPLWPPGQAPGPR